MARLSALIILLLLPLNVYAQVWRATYRPYDFSPLPSKRIPQYLLASTFANLPATGVADGDLGYVEDTDLEYVRRAGTWTVLTHTGFDGWIKAATIVQLAINTDTVVVGDTTMVSFANKMEIQGLLGLRTHSATPGEAPSLNSYRSRGSRAIPSHVLANDSIFKFNANAYNQSGSYLTPFSINITAAEDQTATNRGVNFSLANTKIGDSVASTTLIAHGTKWYLGDPATDNYATTSGAGTMFGRLYVREGFSTGSPADDNSLQPVIGLYRYRDGSTAPGAAGFGSRLSYRLEGFTNNSDVEAAGISGSWDQSQTNDTTTRDSYLGFWTMLNNSLTEQIRLNSIGQLFPLTDNTQVFGGVSNRWGDIWGGRGLFGVGSGASGTGVINAANESDVVSLFSDVAQSAQFTAGKWLVRRSRGTLASKTNVITGDYLSTWEIQPDPAGSGGFVQGGAVAWITESRTASNAIGVAEEHYTRGTAAGAGQTLRWGITANGNVVTGNRAAALATTATDGFLYIPTCAGVPTGVPTAYTGTVPMVYDTTNLRLYVYSGGAWRIH